MKKTERDLYEMFYWVSLIIIFISIIIFAIGFIYFSFNEPSKMANYITSGIGLLAIFIAGIAILESSRNVRLDKRSERKVEIISSVKSDEIKSSIEALYKGVLKGKSIDKIEIVNTSVGQNDNSKNVIIIYH